MDIIITIATFVGIYLLIHWIMLSSERNLWNGGICKQNRLPWVWFANDSQGCRGYKAGACVLWCSWGGDK